MSKLPALIAHRGASSVAPESTKAAIQAAITVADWIELDVQMTRDGQLIVFHDTTLRRTTNGIGKVSEMNYPQLAKLDAGSWFDARFSNQRILLVSQAIKLIPSRLGIILDIKGRVNHRPLLIRRLKLLIRSLPRVKRFLVSSQDAKLLNALCDLPVLLGLISAGLPLRSLRTAADRGYYSWHPKHTTLTAKHIIQAQQAGLNVFTWTVDDSRRARQLIRWNVDGIFTNNPAALCKAIR